MKTLLARLLGRNGGLQDRALVSVTFHPKGTLFEPYERCMTARGPASNETLEPDHWTVITPDAGATVLGEAALAAFSRVRTVKGRKEGMWGRSGYADEVREALALKPRSALWSAAGKVTLSVDGDRLRVRPMRPEGAAGGFVCLKAHNIPDIALADLTADQLGAALSQARDLVLPSR